MLTICYSVGSSEYRLTFGMSKRKKQLEAAFSFSFYESMLLRTSRIRNAIWLTWASLANGKNGWNKLRLQQYSGTEDALNVTRHASPVFVCLTYTRHRTGRSWSLKISKFLTLNNIEYLRRWYVMEEAHSTAKVRFEEPEQRFGYRIHKHETNMYRQ